MAIEKAFNFSFFLKSPDASAPAVENETAPNVPAKKRSAYCASKLGKTPVRNKTPDVVMRPNTKSLTEVNLCTRNKVEIAPKI